MARALIYQKEGHLPMKVEFEKLRALCTQLREYAPSELANQLDAAFLELEEATRAKLKLNKGTFEVGFGVNKAKKAIACENIITLARQIKAW